MGYLFSVEKLSRGGIVVSQPSFNISVKLCSYIIIRVRKMGKSRQYIAHTVKNETENVRQQMNRSVPFFYVRGKNWFVSEYSSKSVNHRISLKEDHLILKKP